jgi:hypothetical protein
VIASGGEQLALVVYLVCWPARGDPVALAVPVDCDREQLIAITRPTAILATTAARSAYSRRRARTRTLRLAPLGVRIQIPGSRNGWC